MKVLLFGATGSAGGSVLKVCLSSPAVDEVRAVTRRPLSIANARLREFVHSDFQDYASVAAAFSGVDACLFCLGISIAQVSGEAEYRRITHDFALAAAKTLRAQSPSAAFHFISGRGSGAESRMLWARVKGETERELLEGYDAVCWRPAAIDGEASKSSPWIYNVMRPMFRLFRPFRSLYVSGEDLGRAMLEGAAEGFRRRFVENREIRDLADRARGRT